MRSPLYRAGCRSSADVGAPSTADTPRGQLCWRREDKERPLRETEPETKSLRKRNKKLSMGKEIDEER